MEMQHEEYSALNLKKAIEELITERSTVYLKSPAICGVYILYQDSTVVYVGKSCDVHKRVTQHTDKDFTSYRVVPCDDSINGDMERMLIEFFLPRYNTDSVTMKYVDEIGFRSNRNWGVFLSLNKNCGFDLTGQPVTQNQRGQ
jgi:hypothetical protein